jgi:hypothetical protein
MPCALLVRVLSRLIRVGTVGASDVGSEAVGERGLVVASGVEAAIGIVRCCTSVVEIVVVVQTEPVSELVARSSVLRLAC